MALYLQLCACNNIIFCVIYKKQQNVDKIFFYVIFVCIKYEKHKEKRYATK